MLDGVVDSGKYILLRADGSFELVDVPSIYEADTSCINDRFSSLIGADRLEFVRIKNDIYFIVDELGKILDNPKPVNMKASLFYGGFLRGDYIVGDVLIAGFDGIEDIIGLTDSQIKYFTSFF